MKNSIKLHIINLLDDIENGKYSNIQMNYYFDKENFNQKEKLFITNVINMTIKNLIYIDYLLSKATKNIQKRKIKQLLRISIAQLFFMDSDNAGVVYEAVEVAKNINKFQGSFVNGVLQNILDNKKQYDREIPKDKKDGILYSYPQWFVNKLKVENPDSYIEIMKSYKKRSYLSVRYNKKMLSKEKFEKIIKEINSEILFNFDEIYYLSNGNILKHEQFKNGNIVIQDGSSYIVVKNLDIKENDIVLDTCAAPGGKTLAILQTYSPKKVMSLDIYEHKINILNEMKKKYGYENLEIKNYDATKIDEMEEQFDVILVDAPCSGLGVLRKKPEKIYKLDNNQIKDLKKLQKKIFDSAYKRLKVGGTIVYSTCTFSKNENSNNVKSFLEKYENIKVSELYIPENIFTEKDEYGGIYIDYRNEYLDGFYIVKFLKIF